MLSVNRRRVRHASYSALGIYVEDIVLSAGQEGIRFRGKGEYEREVPLPFEFESLKLLCTYLRAEDLTAGTLFRTGKYKDQRMSYGVALHQWTKLREQAEVKCPDPSASAYGRDGAGE